VPPGLTSDGHETQFGTNHVGHALLAKLLMPTLLRTAEAPDSDMSIIGLSSVAHKFAPFGGVDFEDSKDSQKNFSASRVMDRASWRIFSLQRS
jgi:retinol dehydrogenase 12